MLQLTSSSSAVFMFFLVLGPFATEGKNAGYMLFFHSYHFLKTIIWFGSQSEQKVSVICVSSGRTLICDLLVSQIK